MGIFQAAMLVFRRASHFTDKSPLTVARPVSPLTVARPVILLPRLTYEVVEQKDGLCSIFDRMYVYIIYYIFKKVDCFLRFSENHDKT